MVDIYYIEGVKSMVTKDNKMSYTSKQMKSDLWDIYYKLQEAGASKAVKYAIIDVMVLRDKEEDKEKENVS